jgi:beta-glucanase (GH16 family)
MRRHSHTYYVRPPPLSVQDKTKCWPTGAEIDIMEKVGGSKNDSNFGTYHWGQACGVDDWKSDGQRSGHYPHPPNQQYSSAFHNFTAYYNKTAITWEVDGHPYVSRIAGHPVDLFVPSWPLFTIFNTAMTYWTGPQPPPSVGFPVYMYVDWVQFEQWSGPGGSTGDFPIPTNISGLSPGI